MKRSPYTNPPSHDGHLPRVSRPGSVRAVRIGATMLAVLLLGLVQWLGLVLGALLFFAATGAILLAVGGAQRERCFLVYGFYCLGPAAMFLYAYWRLT